MRRRWLALAAAVVVLAAAVPAAAAYTALCAGPVATDPLLVEAREAGRQTAEETTGPALLAAASRASRLDRLVGLTQSDQAAFPAHALAGAALEASRCPPTSAADQWRRAAAHAWIDGAAGLAAGGLARTLGAPAARELLRAYAAEEPWHAANLARVIASLGPAASPP